MAGFLLGLGYECGLLCLGCFSWDLVWVCDFVCFLCVLGFGVYSFVFRFLLILVFGRFVVLGLM